MKSMIEVFCSFLLQPLLLSTSCLTSSSLLSTSPLLPFSSSLFSTPLISSSPLFSSLYRYLLPKLLPFLFPFPLFSPSLVQSPPSSCHSSFFWCHLLLVCSLLLSHVVFLISYKKGEIVEYSNVKKSFGSVLLLSV